MSEQIDVQEAWVAVGGNPDVKADKATLLNCLNFIRTTDDGNYDRLEKILSDEVVIHAAKSLEKFKKQSTYEWTDEQFEIWWNDDPRCNREEKITTARMILQAAANMVF